MYFKKLQHFRFFGTSEFLKKTLQKHQKWQMFLLGKIELGTGTLQWWWSYKCLKIDRAHKEERKRQDSLSSSCCSAIDWLYGLFRVLRARFSSLYELTVQWGQGPMEIRPKFSQVENWGSGKKSRATFESVGLHLYLFPHLSKPGKKKKSPTVVRLN